MLDEDYVVHEVVAELQVLQLAEPPTVSEAHYVCSEVAIYECQRAWTCVLSPVHPKCQNPDIDLVRPEIPS